MINPAVKNVYLHIIIFDLTIYIRIGIVFDLFVYKTHGDSDGAFLCTTEIPNSRLYEMDFSAGRYPKTKNKSVSSNSFLNNNQVVEMIACILNSYFGRKSAFCLLNMNIYELSSERTNNS